MSFLPVARSWQQSVYGTDGRIVDLICWFGPGRRLVRTQHVLVCNDHQEVGWLQVVLVMQRSSTKGLNSSPGGEGFGLKTFLSWGEDCK